MNLLPWLPGRPERTEVIHQLTQAAFAPYAALDRPSGALSETIGDVEADLAAGGGLIAYDERWERPLGALRWRIEDDHLWVKRVAVDPAYQRQGVGDLLMDACQGICHATGRTRIRLGVRHALDTNQRWYERRGYRRVLDHDDWAEYEVEAAPIAFTGERATVWKYEDRDHLQARFEVDVVERCTGGTWVRIPRFVPHFDGQTGQLAAITPRTVAGWLPAAEWWTAWFSGGRRRLKVDICTPAVRRADGDFEFRDLSLDVVVRDDEPAQLVDQDEFEEAAYDAELAARALASADDVLRRISAGEEPFAAEGYRRIEVSG